jgi:hypothetical protein
MCPILNKVPYSLSIAAFHAAPSYPASASVGVQGKSGLHVTNMHSDLLNSSSVSVSCAVFICLLGTNFVHEDLVDLAMSEGVEGVGSCSRADGF